MADERTFIRVHDDIEDHPKIAPLSDAAYRLLINSWAYCSRQRTDGFMRDVVWRKRGAAKARRELEAELVHEPGHQCGSCPPCPAAHVVFHDYLDWQRSAAKIEERVDAKRRAAAMGNHKRWHAARSIVDPDCEFCDPDAIAGAIPDRSPPDDDGNPSSDRRTDPKLSPESETETERDKDPRPGTPATGTSSASSRTGEQRRGRAGRGELEALAGSACTPAAYRLVTEFAGSRTRRPPARVLQQLGPLTDELLAQDWPPDLVAQALTAWGDKGLDPSRLHSVANEIANRRPAAGNGAGPGVHPTDAAIATLLGGSSGPPPRQQLGPGGPR